MLLSFLFLALVMFLNGAMHLGWFAVSATFLGITELVTAILLILEGGPVLYKRYFVR